jgi:hypothetical protein
MKNLGFRRYALTMGAAAALLSGCSGSQSASGMVPGTNGLVPAASMDLHHLAEVPLTSHQLCEKLIKGDPNTTVKKDCSGGAHKELNAEVCYEPSGNCFSIPRSATVKLKQSKYRGTITASDTTKSLPAKILHNPHYISALCGDKGKSPSQDPEDIIRFSPSSGHGPSSKFTITDDGPRNKSHSGSSTCNIVFYDHTDRFVEFMVVMLSS